MAAAGQLIRAAADNAPDEVTQIKLVRHKIVREKIQHVGMAGRVRFVHLVDRLNQAAAEQLGPNIVDSGTFEERLLAVDRGFNEPFAAAKFWDRYTRYFLGRFGRH